MYFLGVSLNALVLIEERTVPKTTSGKIARAWSRKAYMQRTLSVLRESTCTDTTVESGTARSAVVVSSAEAEFKNEEASKHVDSPMSSDDVLEALVEEVSRLLECDPDNVDTKLPLMDVSAF